MNNPIFGLLCELGVCSRNKVEMIQSFVRDRQDVDVWRCTKSKAIFLGNVDHIDLSHYDKKPPTHQYGHTKRPMVTSNDDTERRFRSFKNLIRGKKWLDIGTGSGAILDVLGPIALEFAAVEPQEQASQALSSLGYHVFRRIEDAPVSSYDIVTLFHVFEHLKNPANILEQIHLLLKNNGTLIIEVPHANDFLIQHSSAFRAHTFWSEHLVLHTRETLVALVEHAGYTINAIESVQRYPLANHLYWLANGQPGGQNHWSHLNNPLLEQAYMATLAKNNMTDTLILSASKTA